ncbi:RNA polymerase sigma factor [Microbulbifer harenosus]|uniref:Sigma-70 family RNA polymerase sigma factor n=1 Tax=Microbulbifer harenosus TaxID=2576840 RepID=A0ABY2UGF2_9GAMM|nr:MULTISPECIES: sigma-70 family RNA polymerase sigma factor [Microbulbifer]QIL91643.1 sigma-70 family RNA polymerase sigma factor [Microbulbifer sp. SH-1]TLM76755.1 sigma-70 family RNA polymerase sigma factor [Microbulbifer harenosus]
MPELNAEQSSLTLQLIEGAPRLKRFVQRHADNATDVADLYQESITRVLEQAREQRINNPVAYAIRIARNLIINRGPVAHAEETEMVCPGPSPEENTSRQQQLQEILTILETMPALRREVFIRRRLDGESREEIARALGISVEAVKKHISRALADIQRALDEGRIA